MSFTKIIRFLSHCRAVAQRIWSWQPLTFRGAIALAFAAVALWYFALPADDLVAAILGGAVIGVVILTLPVALFIRFRLGRRLRAECHFEINEPLAGQEIAAGIALHESNVPPFFSLAVKRRFAQSGVSSPRHLVFGAERGETRHLIDTVFFPHRGVWRLTSLSFTLRDALGLTALHWELPIESDVEVSAPRIPIRPLPIVAGSARAGDQLQFTRERSGDPFDIKPYDPSDGITRILWKTYARTGELVVRRPEPAAIPEGEVAVYLVARREDDGVAGALRSYLDYLEKNLITVLFGTDGLNEQPFVASQIAADLLPTMNRVVWEKNLGTGSGFDRFLTGLSTAGRPVYRAIVFGPEAQSDSWYEQVAITAAKHLVQLSVVVVPESLGRKTTLALPNAVYQTARDALHSWRKKSSRRKNVPLAGIVAQSGNEFLICEGFEP